MVFLVPSFPSNFIGNPGFNFFYGPTFNLHPPTFDVISMNPQINILEMFPGFEYTFLKRKKKIKNACLTPT
jgi:hypothetical protein